ncbi:carbon storage regulator [Neobacillus cucumis]|nr:carbon storage regulator [Neobacillus cucumis]
MEAANLLIVGREIGQSVIIGDVIKITVQKRCSKPQLLIDAPKHISISQNNQIGSSRVRLKKSVRMIGKQTLIGDLIKVALLQTDSGLLRIGIEAPKDIRIFREELYKTFCLSE